MNELKPEDVMRALECCVEDTSEACLKCVFGLTPPYPVCKTMVAKQALALLREKDAEIERLTAYNANLLCANTDITNRHKDYVEEAERIARAEAITEFAERLKEALIASGIYPVIVKNSIEKIAKEMKGEKK